MTDLGRLDAIEARMEHGRQDVRWMSRHAASGQTADDIATLLAAVRERDAKLVRAHQYADDLTATIAERDAEIAKLRAKVVSQPVRKQTKQEREWAKNRAETEARYRAALAGEES